MRAMILVCCLMWVYTAAAQEKEYLEISISNDSVVVANVNVYENCAARFDVRVDTTETGFLITQTDTVREKMRCMCVFRIETVFRGLEPGMYPVRVRRQYLTKYGYPADSLRFIQDGTILVSSRRLARSIDSRQGPCTPLGLDPVITPRAPVLTVHPNPATDFTSLEVTLSESRRVDVTLFTVEGARIRSMYSAECAGGSTTISLDTGMLPAGAYYLVVESGDGINAAPLHIVR